MSETYTKLFSSITASTIWLEPAGTRLTWITMLAMADRNGCVYSSLPGLADGAKVSRQEVEAALQCLGSPDPDSRTKDNEGRRIEEIDGGWHLLNHGKFRNIRSADERREYQREYMRRRRGQGKLLTSQLAMSTEVCPPSPSPSPAPTQTPRAKQRRADRPLQREREEARAADPPSEPEQKPSFAGAASKALLSLGIRCTPSHPDLIKLLAQGVTLQELVDTGTEAQQQGKTAAGYVFATVRGRREDAQRRGALPNVRASAGPRASHITDDFSHLDYGKNDSIALE